MLVEDIVAPVEFLEADVPKPLTVYALFGSVIVEGDIVDELYVAVTLVVPELKHRIQNTKAKKEAKKNA